jgi:hypothetical protein
VPELPAGLSELQVPAATVPPHSMGRMSWCSLYWAWAINHESTKNESTKKKADI